MTQKNKPLIKNDESLLADDIFLAAMEFETENERRTFLERACAGDKALHRAVDSLFESLSAAQAYFHHEPIEISIKELIDILTDLLNPFERMNA